MLSYFWIAVGSALGGMARYGCSGLAARLIGETFPWGTLIVNVAEISLIASAHLLKESPTRATLYP